MKPFLYNYTRLLVHNIVRWLSKGRVLQRFWFLRKEFLFFEGRQQNVKNMLRHFQLLQEMIKKWKLLDFG